jgi:hypothetical protein
MSRKEEAEARIEETKKSLKDLISDYGPIDSINDVQRLCQKYSDVGLHFFDTDHNLTTVSPEYWLLYLGENVEEFSSSKAMKLIQEYLNHFVPDYIRRGEAIWVQILLSVIAIAANSPLPPFRLICKTTNNYLKEKLGSDYFEACLYGEFVFSPRNKFLGTLVITKVFPLPNYDEKSYKKEKFWMYPSSLEAVWLFARVILKIRLEGLKKLFALGKRGA